MDQKNMEPNKDGNSKPLVQDRDKQSSSPKSLLKQIMKLNETQASFHPNYSPTIQMEPLREPDTQSHKRHRSQRLSGIVAAVKTPKTLLKNFVSQAPTETPLLASNITTNSNMSEKSSMFLPAKVMDSSQNYRDISVTVSDLEDEEALLKQQKSFDSHTGFQQIFSKGLKRPRKQITAKDIADGMKQSQDAEEDDEIFLQRPKMTTKKRKKITAEDIAMGMKQFEDAAGAAGEKTADISDMSKSNLSLGFLTVNSENAEKLLATTIPNVEDSLEGSEDRSHVKQSKLDTIETEYSNSKHTSVSQIGDTSNILNTISSKDEINKQKGEISQLCLEKSKATLFQDVIRKCESTEKSGDKPKKYDNSMDSQQRKRLNLTETKPNNSINYTLSDSSHAPLVLKDVSVSLVDIYSSKRKEYVSKVNEKDMLLISSSSDSEVKISRKISSKQDATNISSNTYSDGENIVEEVPDLTASPKLKQKSNNREITLTKTRIEQSNVETVADIPMVTNSVDCSSEIIEIFSFGSLTEKTTSSDTNEDEIDEKVAEVDGKNEMENCTSSQEERNTSSQEERNTSSQEERNTSTREERNRSTQEERNRSTQEERNRSTREERNRSTREERNRSTPEERNRSTQEERNRSTLEERNGSTQEERNGSTQEERNRSTPEERNRSTQEERNRSTREERNRSTREERNRSTREERNRSTQEERNRSTQEERNKSTQEERNRSTQEERNRSSQEESNRSSQEESNRSSQEESNRSTQEERNTSSQEERNRSTQEERNTSSQEESENQNNHDKMLDEQMELDKETDNDFLPVNNNVILEIQQEEMVVMKNNIIQDENEIIEIQDEPIVEIQDEEYMNLHNKEVIDTNREAAFDYQTENKYIKSLQRKDQVTLNESIGMKHSHNMEEMVTDVEDGSSVDVKYIGETRKESDRNSNESEVTITYMLQKRKNSGRVLLRGEYDKGFLQDKVDVTKGEEEDNAIQSKEEMNATQEEEIPLFEIDASTSEEESSVNLEVDMSAKDKNDVNMANNESDTRLNLDKNKTKEDDIGEMQAGVSQEEVEDGEADVSENESEVGVSESERKAGVTQSESEGDMAQEEGETRYKSESSEIPEVSQAGEAQYESESGETPEEGQISEAQYESESGETPKEDQAGETQYENESGETPEEGQIGETQYESEGGETPKKDQAGESQYESESGEAQYESEGGETPKEEQAGVSQYESESGETQYESEGGETPKEEQAGESQYESGSGEAQYESESGETLEKGQAGKTQYESESGETLEKGQAGKTQYESESGETQYESEGGETPKEEQAGESQYESESGEAQYESESGETPDKSQAGETPGDGQVGETPEEDQAGEAQYESKSGETPDEGQTGETPGDDQVDESGVTQYESGLILTLMGDSIAVTDQKKKLALSRDGESEDEFVNVLKGDSVTVPVNDYEDLHEVKNVDEKEQKSESKNISLQRELSKNKIEQVDNEITFHHNIKHSEEKHYIKIKESNDSPKPSTSQSLSFKHKGTKRKSTGNQTSEVSQASAHSTSHKLKRPSIDTSKSYRIIDSMTKIGESLVSRNRTTNQSRLDSVVVSNKSQQQSQKTDQQIPAEFRKVFELPKPKKKKTINRVVRRDNAEHCVPTRGTTSLLSHYSKISFPSSCADALGSITDDYFENLFEVLSSYANKERRLTICQSDVELYLKNVGFVNDKKSLNSLIREHLSLSDQQALIPVARASISSSRSRLHRQERKLKH